MKKPAHAYPEHICTWLLLAFMFMPLPGFAQGNCNKRTIDDARQQFNAGQLEEVSTILESCLPHFISKDDRAAAHELLAKTYLALDDFAPAREQVKEMLRYKPDYEPDRSQESLMFAELVNTIRTEMEKEAIRDLLVTSATKRAQLASDAPATIYVRTHEQIVRRGYRNLLDLLEDIPEVEIQKNSISEFRNSVTMRGVAGNEKFIIMLDGVRITPATGDPYPLGTNFSLANARSVEVILGPSSALYGVDAFSGIINIITQDREIEGATVSTSYGRYNTTDSYIVAGIHTNDIGITFTGQYYHSQEADLYNIYKDEFRWYNEKYRPEGVVEVDGTEQLVTPDARKRKFEMPSSSYFINTRVNFGNFEMGITRHQERHSSSINVDPRYTLYTREAFISDLFQSVYARHIYKSSAGRWTLQSMLVSSDFVMDPQSGFINRYTEYNKGYKYQFARSRKIEEQWEYDFNEQTSLIAGVSAESLSALPKPADLPVAFNPRIPADNQDIYYINTDTVDASGRSLRIPQEFHYMEYQNYGTFMQVHSKVLPRTELTLGARFDYNTRFGSVLNPRFGVVIKPVEKVKVKLLYGRSFLAPSPWKAYSTFGSFDITTAPDGSVTGLTSSFFHIPNTGLNPERLYSTEGSIIFFPSHSLTISVNAYYNKIGDLINLQAAQGPGTFRGVPVDYIEKAVNSGDAHTYGGTIQASYTREISDHHMSLNASYSFVDGKVDDHPLVLASRNTAKAVAEWSYRKLSASLRLISRSSTNSVIPDVDHYLSSKGFTILNAYVRYQLIEKPGFIAVLSVRGDNITNAHYYNAAAGQDSFAATPQDPLRTALGFTVNFK